MAAARRSAPPANLPTSAISWRSSPRPPDWPPPERSRTRSPCSRPKALRIAGNVIWFLLGGWCIALLWLLGAVLFALSIVGLPLTIAALQMARLSAWPFGKDVVHVRELDARGVTAG